MPRIAIIIALLLGNISAQEAARDQASLIARRVDTHYNLLRSVRMRFTETLETAGVRKNETGTLLLKKPGRMRWDYEAPQKKLFLSDGKTAYFYLPAENQVRRAPVKKLDDLQSPLRFLLGRSQIATELEKMTSKPAGANVVLSGRPKHAKERVERIELEVNPRDQIERLVIEEVDGTRTEFRFTNIEENVPVTDAQFRFQLPVGVEVVETKELQP